MSDVRGFLAINILKTVRAELVEACSCSLCHAHWPS